MTTTGATYQPARLIVEAQLNRIIPISIYGFDLQDMAGTGLDYRHGNRFSVLFVNLCHTDLAAENTFAHRFVP
jgi:hypothetical protein